MQSKSSFLRRLTGLLAVAAILLLFIGSLEARFVTLSEARTAAQSLAALENLRPDLRLTPGVFSVGAVRALTSQGQPIGYLVDLHPQGFMILSAVTEAVPEVFISFSGDYASLKGHSLLAGILDYLEESRNVFGSAADRASRGGLAESASVPSAADIVRHERLWNLILGPWTLSLSSALGIATEQDVPPLLTCHWKQGSPYNLFTPWINGKKTPAGCVAIAMAQVMYYWKYPDQGDGSNQYPWHGQTLSASFDHPYYWDRMLDSYDLYYTTEQAGAVAQLVLDAGISVWTDYELGGSGAELDPRAFCGHFRYSTSVWHVYRSWIGDWTAWFNLLEQQMDRGQPVILGVDSGSMGHALVVDGYRTSPSDQIHVNLGWGANYDCYTSVEDICGYTIGDAIIDIHPGDVTLTVEETANGATEPRPGGYQYPWKTTATVTAYPDPHFELRDWSGDASGSSNPLELMMDRNRQIAANFQRIICAPLNASGQRVLNRSLSQAEYVNVLTFQANPDNVDITGYKIYLIEETLKTELAAVDASTFKYLHRNVARDKVYIYEIVAVNSEPREGHPATVVVQ
jgi:hypothetical protein